MNNPNEDSKWEFEDGTEKIESIYESTSLPKVICPLIFSFIQEEYPLIDCDLCIDLVRSEDLTEIKGYLLCKDCYDIEVGSCADCHQYILFPYESYGMNDDEEMICDNCE